MAKHDDDMAAIMAWAKKSGYRPPGRPKGTKGKAKAAAAAPAAPKRGPGRPKKAKTVKYFAGEPVKKVHEVVSPVANPFHLQDNLRKMGYFARAISLTKVATNAPAKALRTVA
jgi:hypothetical protein